MNSRDQHVVASPFVKGRQHQLKFQLILSEASQLFNWQGSRATTLADIAGTMNLTKTCLYYYVRNKEDLVHKCYVASCDMWLRRAVEANAQKGSGLDKIIFMIGGHLQQYAATMRDESPHFALLTEVSSLNDEYRQDIAKRWSEIFVLCQSMVEEGIEQGVITDLDPSVVALAIFSIIQWFPVWMNRKHAANADSVMASVLSLVTNG
ncbi:MAG: AcrR family transcriptional regulator, partial [Porticoccaceae bacterium]